MKPLKSEFPNFVQMTTNIEDRLLNFQIENAFYYDLKPKLGSLAEDIYNLATGDETKPETLAFYNNFVKRVWILLTYRRLVTNHGNNITQYAITKFRDPAGTTEQISPQERANIINETSRDISVAETNMFTELSTKNWTFDNTAYRKMCAPTKSFGISAINK